MRPAIWLCLLLASFVRADDFRPEYWLTVTPASNASPDSLPFADGRDTAFTPRDARAGLPGAIIKPAEFQKLGLGVNEYLRRVGKAGDRFLATGGVVWRFVPASKTEPAYCVATHPKLSVAPLLLSQSMYSRCKEKLGNNLLFLLLEQREIRVYSREKMEDMSDLTPLFATIFAASNQQASAELWFKDENSSLPIAIGAVF